MQISLIAAMTTQRVIGRDGSMPWHLPADLAWFKQQTLGKPVIMGRKTWQSIGRPLPGRCNIVLSRQPGDDDRVRWATSLAQALQLAREQGAAEAMIIGGAEIYRQALPCADRLYLTEIDAQLQGDTFFPSLTEQDWHPVFSQTREADERNPYRCRFVILHRRTAADD